jgi:hypothetical protein
VAILRRALALAVSLLLGGCAAPTTTVQVAERGAVIPDGRISIPLSRQRLPPSQPQDGLALEIGLVAMSGRDTQSLPGGAPPIAVGNETFNGPLTLRYEFDYTHVDLRWRGRKFFGESQRFGLEGLAGFGFANFGIDAFAPGQHGIRNEDSWGFSAAIGAIYKLFPSTSVQARFGGYTGGRYIFDNIAATRFEVGVVQALGSHAALRAGYASWDLKVEPGGSDIRARFSGPALGLDLAF